MRIALIDVNYGTGSTGKIVADIFSYSRKTNDEVCVFYGRGKKVKEKNVYKFGYDLETFLHAIIARIFGINGYFSFFSTLRLIRRLKKFEPDLINVHEIHAYFLNFEMLFKYAKKKNIKIVHTLHSEYTYTGKCGHSFECVKWKTKCKSCPHLDKYVKSICFDFTSFMFAKKKKMFLGLDNVCFVTPSMWLMNRAKESFLGKFPITCINNGIDTNCFRCSASNFREKFNLNGKYIILSVAPNIMSHEKGGDLILNVSKKFASNKNVVFVLVGSKNKRPIYLKENVLLIPRINDKYELSKIYNSANLFLICSLKENFPTTMLEAQCCGLCVVGFDTGGVKETSVLDFNKFVKYGDLTSLYKNICLAISHPVGKENNSYKAISYFSSDVMSRKYYDLFHSLQRKV